MHDAIKDQFETTLHSIKRTLILLAIPAAQLFLLRVFFRGILDIRIGWPAFTDFDLVLPGFVGFLVLRLAIDFVKPQPLKLQSRAIRLNTILMTVLILFTAAKSLLVQGLGFEAWYALWFAIAGAMALASLSIFVHPRTYFSRDVVWAIFPCALLSLSMILINNYDVWLKPTWEYVGPMVAASTFHFLQIFWGDAVNAYFSSMHLMIHHEKSSILIGTRCGGFDAITFFMILFALYFMAQRKNFKLGAWVAFAGLGIVLMYFANVVRIASIFSLSIWIAEWGFRPAARTWFIYAFHGHVGWILYLGMAGAYFHGLTALAARREEAIATAQARA